VLAEDYSAAPLHPQETAATLLDPTQALQQIRAAVSSVELVLPVALRRHQYLATQVQGQEHQLSEVEIKALLDREDCLEVQVLANLEVSSVKQLQQQPLEVVPHLLEVQPLSLPAVYPEHRCSEAPHRTPVTHLGQQQRAAELLLEATLREEVKLQRQDLQASASEPRAVKVTLHLLAEACFQPRTKAQALVHNQLEVFLQPTPAQDRLLGPLLLQQRSRPVACLVVIHQLRPLVHHLPMPVDLVLPSLSPNRSSLTLNKAHYLVVNRTHLRQVVNRIQTPSLVASLEPSRMLHRVHLQVQLVRVLLIADPLSLDRTHHQHQHLSRLFHPSGPLRRKTNSRLQTKHPVFSAVKAHQQHLQPRVLICSEVRNLHLPRVSQPRVTRCSAT
jgi:hypothetical protein